VNVHLLGTGYAALTAAGAGALIRRTLTVTSICLAVASGLVGVGFGKVVDVHVLATLVFLLEVGKVASLVVHIHDGLVALLVEATEFLTSGSVGSLVEVAGQTSPTSIRLLGKAQLVVHRLSLLCGLCLGVEVLEGLGELVAIAVLLVGSKGSLDGFVGDDVAMGEVFGEDTRAGLLLLLDVVVAVFGLLRRGSLLAGDFIKRLCRGDMDRVGAKLCVVEEQGRLRSSRLLKGDRGSLSVVARGLYADGLDLAAEAEEGLDLVFASLRADVLNIDGGGHVDVVFLGVLVDICKCERELLRSIVSIRKIESSLESWCWRYWRNDVFIYQVRRFCGVVQARGEVEKRTAMT
jgi:hypothetical protein